MIKVADNFKEHVKSSSMFNKGYQKQFCNLHPKIENVLHTSL